MKCDEKKETCQKCMAGRVLFTQDTTQICEPCQASCSECSSRTACTKCKEGYFMNSSGVCLKALSNCASYSISGGSCDVCNYGYRKVIRESGVTVCVSCFSSGMGYFNCFNACSASGKNYPYRRDNDEYNTSAEKKRQETNPNMSSSSTTGNPSIQMFFNVIMFFGLFLAIVL